MTYFKNVSAQLIEDESSTKVEFPIHSEDHQIGAKVRRKGTNKIYALKTIKKSDVIEGNLTDQVEREIEVTRLSQSI